MPYPTYKYTTLDALLEETKVEMLMDTNGNSEDLYILKFLMKCSAEMMTRTEFIEKDALLPIDCFIAELPCDFVKFDRPYPLAFTVNGVINTNVCGWFSATYTGGPIFDIAIDSTTSDWGLPVIQVQNGQIQFSNNIAATQCVISYLGLNIDDQGRLKIPVINSRPIIAGACYMYKRALEKPRATWQDYKDEWTLGKMDRRGTANMLNSFEQQQLSRTMNTMLNAYGTGIGVW